MFNIAKLFGKRDLPPEVEKRTAINKYLNRQITLTALAALLSVTEAEAKAIVATYAPTNDKATTLNYEAPTRPEAYHMTASDMVKPHEGGALDDAKEEGVEGGGGDGNNEAGLDIKNDNSLDSIPENPSDTARVIYKGFGIGKDGRSVYKEKTAQELGITTPAVLPVKERGTGSTISLKERLRHGGEIWIWDGGVDKKTKTDTYWLFNVELGPNDDILAEELDKYPGVLFIKKIKLNGETIDGCYNAFFVVFDKKIETPTGISKKEKMEIEFERGNFVKKIKFNRSTNEFYFKNEFDDIYKAKKWHIEWFNDDSAEGWVESVDNNRYIVDIPGDPILVERLQSKRYKKTLTNWSYNE